MGEARITVLVENTAGGRGLPGEHGLSFWIELGSRRILFDTGQSDILSHNAPILGIDLREADALALSHGHYDHVGGLKKVLELAPGIPVYLHLRALEEKFTCRDQQSRSIGMEREMAQVLDRRIHDGLGSFIDGPVVILPGVWTTGVIPRKSAFEDTSRVRVAHTIMALCRHNVQRIGLAHCTGQEASVGLQDALPDKCFVCNVRTQIVL